MRNNLLNQDDYNWLIHKAFLRKGLVTEEKCGKDKYNITIDRIQNLKMNIDGKIKIIDEDKSKRDIILEDLRKNLVEIKWDKKDDNLQRLRADWERKYPDIPFGIDITSYNERRKQFMTSVEKYLKKEKGHSKELYKHTDNWHKELLKLQNFTEARDYENKIHGTINDWNESIKINLKEIRGIQSSEGPLNKKTKKDYIGSMDNIRKHLKELKKEIRKG